MVVALGSRVHRVSGAIMLLISTAMLTIASKTGLSLSLNPNLALMDSDPLDIDISVTTTFAVPIQQLIVGESYTLEYTVTAGATQLFVPTGASPFGFQSLERDPGTYSVVLECTSETIGALIRGQGTFTLSNVSLRQIGNAVGPRTIVIPLMGQSNMQSFSGDDGGRDFPDGVREFNQAGVVVQATHRLVHRNNNGDQSSIDPAIEFAYEYLALYPQDTLIFVPCADPGTGFGQGNWNPGDPSYNDAVARVNACLNLDPSYQLGCILWVQGERDAKDPVWAPNHAAAFDAMVAALRAAIPAAASVPFILTNMVQEWVTGDADRELVQAGIVDSPNRNANMYFVDARDLPGKSGDVIHYSAASMRTLGKRFFTSFNAVHSLTSPATPLWVIDGTTVSQSPGGLTQPTVNGDIVS